ncbi:869_t:CDS:2 [Diversispora eburnea]|uniref:869_t:CDS:1 n=1 Tax=Diversispora eburnea TaxID=1213867 RepID=A0A9N9BNI4_9GLOM|nr:869_t:CDS:2 [Diversispora eburnea]
MMKLRKKLMLMFSCLSLLFEPKVYAKGGGAGTGGSGGSTSSGGSYTGNRNYSSGSGWVFWYYSTDGGRSCGNYCIIAFSITGFLILLVILTRYTSPPAYDNVSSAPEPSHLHGLRHESTWDAYKAGQKFSRENPVIEDKPPPDHIRYILSLGPKAWKMVLEENVMKSKLATIYNNGLRIEFHKKLDVTVQANYPMDKIINPSDNYSDSESEEIQDVITPTSITGLYEEKNILPTYSQSNKNNFLQFPQPIHMDDTHSSSRNKIAPDDMMTIRSTTSKGGGSSRGGTPKGGRTPRGVTPRGSPRNSLRAVTPTRISISLFLYYEITILSNPNKDTTIVIGLATKPYPSWHKESVGFHSDDGHKFHNESYGGKTYSDSWGSVGDVMGCGYYPDTGIVFFTKNGINLGNAFTGLRHIWFPAVGADNKCKIELNFGSGEKKFWYEEAKGTSVMGFFKSSNTETYDYEEFNKEKI